MAKNTTAPIGLDSSYQAEDDMRTLARAEEVKKDPKRYQAALAKAKEKMAELQALQVAPKK